MPHSDSLPRESPSIANSFAHFSLRHWAPQATPRSSPRPKPLPNAASLPGARRTQSPTPCSPMPNSSSQQTTAAQNFTTKSLQPVRIHPTPMRSPTRSVPSPAFRIPPRHPHPGLRSLRKGSQPGQLDRLRRASPARRHSRPDLGLHPAKLGQGSSPIHHQLRCTGRQRHRIVLFCLETGRSRKLFRIAPRRRRRTDPLQGDRQHQRLRPAPRQTAAGSQGVVEPPALLLTEAFDPIHRVKPHLPPLSDRKRILCTRSITRISHK